MATPRMVQRWNRDMVSGFPGWTSGMEGRGFYRVGVGSRIGFRFRIGGRIRIRFGFGFGGGGKAPGFGEIVQIPEAEMIEEFPGGRVKEGPAGNLGPAENPNQAQVEEMPQVGPAVDPANPVDVGLEIGLGYDHRHRARRQGNDGVDEKAVLAHDCLVAGSGIATGDQGQQFVRPGAANDSAAVA